MGRWNRAEMLDQRPFPMSTNERRNERRVSPMTDDTQIALDALIPEMPVGMASAM
jgi:hypothetical protein